MVGAPGSGKSTYAERLFLSEPGKWIVLELDQWRGAMWTSRRRYWEQFADETNAQRQRALVTDVQEAAFNSALELGYSIILSECHVLPASFIHEELAVEPYGIDIEWKVFLTPLDVLLERNGTRPFDHRVPEDVLRTFHATLHDENAWWRNASNVEVVG